MFLIHLGTGFTYFHLHIVLKLQTTPFMLFVISSAQNLTHSYRCPSLLVPQVQAPCLLLLNIWHLLSRDEERSPDPSNL